MGNGGGGARKLWGGLMRSARRQRRFSCKGRRVLAWSANVCNFFFFLMRGGGAHAPHMQIARMAAFDGGALVIQRRALCLGAASKRRVGANFCSRVPSRVVYISICVECRWICPRAHSSLAGITCLLRHVACGAITVQASLV